LFDKLFNIIESNMSVISVLSYTNNLSRYVKTLDLMHTNIISGRRLVALFNIAGQNSNLNKNLYPYIKKNWHIIWTMYQNDYFGLISIIESLEYVVGDDDLTNDIDMFFRNVVPVQKAVKKLIEKIEKNNTFVKIT